MRSVTVDGLAFCSIAAAARYFGLSHHGMRWRLAHPRKPHSPATAGRVRAWNERRAERLLDAWRVGR